MNTMKVNQVNIKSLKWPLMHTAFYDFFALSSKILPCQFKSLACLLKVGGWMFEVPCSKIMGTLFLYEKNKFSISPMQTLSMQKIIHFWLFWWLIWLFLLASILMSTKIYLFLKCTLANAEIRVVKNPLLFSLHNPQGSVLLLLYISALLSLMSQHSKKQLDYEWL